MTRSRGWRWVSFTMFAAWVLSASACRNMRDEVYPTYADAERSGALSSGLVPAWCLSPDAALVRVAHQSSTRERWLRFTRKPSRQTQINDEGLRAEALTLTDPIGSPNRTWWPPELIGVVRPEAVKPLGYRLYSQSNPIGLLARRGPDVYCWVRPIRSS